MKGITFVPEHNCFIVCTARNNHEYYNTPTYVAGLYMVTCADTDVEKYIEDIKSLEKQRLRDMMQVLEQKIKDLSDTPVKKLT